MQAKGTPRYHQGGRVLTGMRSIYVIASMAMLCITGLIGMLLVDGAWDMLFFLLAILPLLIGIASLWRRRSFE